MMNNEFLLSADTSSAETYNIERSIKFNSGVNNLITRETTVQGDRKKWTWAGWIKNIENTGQIPTVIFQSIQFLGSSTAFGILPSGNIVFGNLNSGQTTGSLETAAVYRDYFAWMHLCFVWDSQNLSTSDRMKIFVNGERITSFNESIFPNGEDSGVNSITQFNTIGGDGLGTFSDFYISDVYFVDGQALDASSFGQFNSNGTWQPKLYSGDYGINGYHLSFSDDSSVNSLGIDSSGRGNNWVVLQQDKEVKTTSFSPQPITGGWRFLDFNVNSAAVGPVNSPLTWTGSVSYGAGKYYVILNAYSIEVQGPTVVTLTLNDGTSVTTPWSTIRNNTDIANQVIGLGGTFTSTVDGRRSNFISTNSNQSLVSVSAGETTGGFSNVFFALVFIPSGVADNDFSNHIVVSSTGIESCVDTPTNYGTDTGVGGEVRGNYATWNPLVSNDTITNGMLDVTGVANYNKSTIGMTSGKWYCEYRINSASVNFGPIWGFINSDNTIYGGLRAAASQYVIVGAGASASVFNHTINLTSGIVGIALDLDNGTCNIYHEDILKFSAVIPLGQTYFFMFYGDFIGSAPANDSVSANFGQYPFAYPAPIGYKALCTANLPSPIITNPSTAMDVLLYTGNGSGNVITGLKFKPDFVWIKNRSTTTNHKLIDSLRGRNRELESNTPDPEFVNNFGLIEFNEDGFDINSDPEYNGLDQSHVAWCWDTNTLATNNTQGSVASVIKTNQNAGFSMVSYLPASSGAFTIGHGLGVPPEFIIAKSRNRSSPWYVYHKYQAVDVTSFGSLDPAINRYLELNSTASVNNSSSFFWGTENFSSATFGMYTDVSCLPSDEMIAYCFASVKDYSSINYYRGNGSSDGTFVYTGFKPKWILLKALSGGNWILIDTLRSGYNVDNDPLYPDLPNQEGTTDLVDILSNGFKFRSTSYNSLNAYYVYVAFAEIPFKYARAR